MFITPNRGLLLNNGIHFRCLNVMQIRLINEEKRALKFEKEKHTLVQQIDIV